LRDHIVARKLGVIMSDTDHVLDCTMCAGPICTILPQSGWLLLETGPIRHAPDLAVEIISPGSEKMDRIDKFEAFGLWHRALLRSLIRRAGRPRRSTAAAEVCGADRRAPEEGFVSAV